MYFPIRKCSVPACAPWAPGRGVQLGRATTPPTWDIWRRPETSGCHNWGRVLLASSEWRHAARPPKCTDGPAAQLFSPRVNSAEAEGSCRGAKKKNNKRKRINTQGTDNKVETHSILLINIYWTPTMCWGVCRVWGHISVRGWKIPAFASFHGKRG